MAIQKNSFGFSKLAIAPRLTVDNVTNKKPKSIVFFVPNVFLIFVLKGLKITYANEKTEIIDETYVPVIR